MTDRADPSWSTVVAEALDAHSAQAWVCCPAIVTAYDAATKTCTARPVTRRPILTEEGAVVHEETKPIQNIPVAFFGGADFSITFEPQSGDTVLLVFQDYSPAGWRGGGQVSDAGDLRAHGPSYPVAYPWHRPGGAPGPDASASVGKPGGLRLNFGASAISAGGGSDFVALAGLVSGVFDALKQAVDSAAQTETGASGVGGMAALASALSAWPTPVASSNLKAD